MQNNTNAVMASDSRMAALKQRANQQQGEVWQPVAGDTLFGIIAGSETTHHPIYGQQRLMLVQSDNGGIVKVWMSKWLTDNLKAQDAQLNDLIALTFGGKHKTAQGREYNAYTLIVDKSEVAA
jgi:hypothetical protein